jgi:hypothetical protein
MQEEMIVYVEGQNTLTFKVEYVAESPATDGTIAGRICNQSKQDLLPLLQPSRDGIAYTFLPGRRYKLTELRAEGGFKLVPDTLE